MSFIIKNIELASASLPRKSRTAPSRDAEIRLKWRRIGEQKKSSQNDRKPGQQGIVTGA